MRSNSIFILFFFCLLFSFSGLAQKKDNWGGPSFDYAKKVENKESKRWTLQEWLEQKDRRYMMDLWLGMYAPSPYEFIISGAYLSYENTSSTSPALSNETKTAYRSSQASVAAYAFIVGLQADYENNIDEHFNDLSGSINLRILGNAAQGTHLNLQYGLLTRNTETAIGTSKLSQQFAGLELDLYLMKHFGLHGLYRGYLPVTNSTLGDVKGSKTEGGAFVDFGPVRIFGNWYSEKQEATLSGAASSTDRTGIMSGIKFFF